MAVLCGMITIQYLARRLSVHNLFTSCIQRYLVSCACDRVMSALSAMLLIYSFEGSFGSDVKILRNFAFFGRNDPLRFSL